MKTMHKKLYESPAMEIISANITSVMYQTSVPLAGDGEEGGEPDAKEGWFEEESDWNVEKYNPWED
ncbi:MAG: hypothetical protein SOX84_01330 [Prevotella sp.]|nr:hypothetical protein [Prevotella sp.]MDY4217418.1 hypothetical protein [Prevotella sp.]